MSDEKIKSFRKGQAIHRPEGWIKSYRAKVLHLLEGKMTDAEYIAFDFLLHAVGWDKGKPNYGKVERNISKLHREWFYRWTRQHVSKMINGLESKLYIRFEGEWIVIPNFEKYQASGGATHVAGVQPQLQGGATTVAESATHVAPCEAESSADTSSQAPLKKEEIRVINIPPKSPTGGRKRKSDIDPRFLAAMEEYPKRSGSNSITEAWSAFKARVAEGVDPEAMLEAIPKYRAWCEAKGRIGTEYVLQASSFFGPKKRGWEGNWSIAPPPGQPHIPHNLPML